MPRNRREWVCYALSVTFLAGGLGLTGAGLVGCSDPKARYEVLSFFFDGVPEPGQEAQAQARRHRRRAWRSEDIVTATSRPATAPAPAVKEVVVYHFPYRNRQCLECHSSETSYQAPTAGATCRKCHKPYYQLEADDWQHGPVAVGQCSLCHMSHSSKYAHLLSAPMPQMCFDCHDAGRTMGRPYHAAAKTQSCTACHDPHSAGNRMLLLDSGAYKRRRAHAQVVPSGHSQWDRDVCSRCHTAEKSNLPVSDIDKICLSCHPKVQNGPAGRKMHDPVTKGQCTSCHVAHKSTLPSLIRPVAEGNCLGCHKLSQIQTPRHPRITRGDCLICHAGHSSPQPHLLRPSPSALVERGVPTTRPAAPGPGAGTRPAGPPPAGGRKP